LKRVVGEAQELAVTDAGYLDRILKGQKKAGSRTFFGFQRQQVLAFEQHAATRHFIGRVAGEYLGEGALARTVLAHDGVDFTAPDREVKVLQNFDTIHARAQSTHFE